MIAGLCICHNTIVRFCASVCRAFFEPRDVAQLGCLPHIDKPRVYNCRDFAYKDTLELVQKPDEQRTEQQKQSDGVAVNYIYNNNYYRYCIAQCKWCEQQNWALALLIKYCTNHHRRLAHNKKSRHITKKASESNAYYCQQSKTNQTTYFTFGWFCYFK